MYDSMLLRLWLLPKNWLLRLLKHGLSGLLNGRLLVLLKVRKRRLQHRRLHDRLLRRLHLI